MKSEQTQSFVIYCSPAGTTRHVAEVMERKLQSLNITPVLFDLGKNKDYVSIISRIEDVKGKFLLFIGSPVYAFHPVSPVMEFISQLPQTRLGYAVPFVTWGGVTKGIALHEMGEGLEKKGYAVLGAAQILAVHSLMWSCASPIGEGHPDAADDRMIEDLTVSVGKKIESDQPIKLPLSDLFDQPKEVYQTMKQMTIEAVRTMLPQRTVNKDMCTQCGVCAKECPAAAVTLDPYPEFGQECFLCYNCMRLCSENAIEADFSMMEGFLKEKAKESAGQPPSEIFI